MKTDTQTEKLISTYEDTVTGEKVQVEKMTHDIVIWVCRGYRFITFKNIFLSRYIKSK